MVKCWVHSCKHYNVRETCRFFSFPLEDKKREHWLELLRYDKEPGPGARICSCHFEGGVKENGPSIFAHNNETFIPHHLSPETRTSRIAEIAMEDIPSTSTDEPYPIESVVLDAHADSDVLFKVECEESDLLEHSENADVTMQAHENDKLNATSNIYIKREIEEAEIITDPEPTENMINIKNEYIDSDDMDDNVLSSEGTSKVDEIVLKNEIDEFEACDTDNIKTEFSGEIRDNRINYEVKIDDEIDASDVSNKFLSCGNCMVTYQDYCTKCDMLVCILNGNTSSNKDSTAIEDIPKDILEIRKSLASFGTFALKVIPEGVRFGPFFGSNTSESSWRIKGGKFLVAEDKSKLLNWMQYINPARNILERNLAVLQHESNLYYRTIREIQEGEELLVYFGEEYEGSLINDVEVEFVPTNVKDIEDAFVCTFCCLGFSSMIYLVNHKTICPYRITGGSLKNEIVQCPHCKLYLEQGEYIDYHIACCREKSAGEVAPFSTNHQTTILTESNSSQYKHETVDNDEIRNLTYIHCEETKRFKCSKCDFSTKFKHNLQRHLGTHERYNLDDHLDTRETVKQFQCSTCDYATNYKNSLIRHSSTHENRFKCPQCDYVTSARNNLRLHFEVHQTCRYFKCSKCDYVTNYKANLNRHFAKHETIKHEKVKQFNCAQCDYVTNDKSNLNRHFPRHETIKHEIIKRFKCAQCAYETHDKTTLKGHLRTHRTVKQFKCAQCDYETHIKWNFKVHLDSHSMVRRFKCSKCDYVTNIKAMLKRHFSTHETVKRFKCSKCDYVTNAEARLRRHLSTHETVKRFKCSQCDYATKYKGRLKQHFSTHERIKRFNCSQCSYATHCQTSFKRHLGIHEPVKQFKCSKCAFATNLRGRLNCHMDKHEELKRFKCSKCDYLTNFKSNLTAHMDMHESVTVFKCSKCDYVTNVKRNMKSHFETHETVKRFKCSKCDYSTNTQSVLKRHFDVHETVKRYRCSKCDYATNISRNLKRHFDTHEAVKRFKCSQCNYATNVQSVLKKHFNDIHQTVKRYQCSKCDYATSVKWNFERHAGTHEG